MVNKMKMLQSIKFETKDIKSSLYYYSDAYILVTRDITATRGDENTNVAIKNCASFTRCVTHVNDEYIDTAESIGIAISIYNLIEFSDNYSHTFGILWQFKRNELPVIDARNPDSVSRNNSSSFKYKSGILGKPANDGVLKKCKNSCTIKMF